jgi:hypothetical protein
MEQLKEPMYDEGRFDPVYRGAQVYALASKLL